MAQDQSITTLDRLIADAADGSLSRRELVKRAAALGLGTPMIAALSHLSAGGSAQAQGEVTLSFDAGCTGGGGASRPRIFLRIAGSLTADRSLSSTGWLISAW